MKPVYMINGFLESGKTSFISYTLAQPYFRTAGRTLLILCEEGEEEYEASLLKKNRTIVETIEDEENFTAEYLLELDKKYNPERVVIEYNGTICNGEAHIHISLSDDKGNVIGGHLEKGCLINTTCEVVLGVLEEYDSCRKFDENTGYDEIEFIKK